MLKTWSESSTYGDATWGGDGISTDGVDASATADGSTIADIQDLAMHFDVTGTVQDWANNPSQNFGWTLLNTGSDGWRFVSSERRAHRRPPDARDQLRRPRTGEHRAVPPADRRAPPA